jgi:hypothetical protein
MRIAKTNALPFLPVPRGQVRDRAQPDSALVATTGQGTQITRATRTVEDIKQAQLMLKRQHTRSGYETIAEASRQQRAVSAYQSLQQSDERAYVSEVLGIDVFA